MIDYLELTNFKAYEKLRIDINKNNILIYGDNGTGKSSIYESLKIAFFKQRLIDNISFRIEEKEQKINEVFSREYDNKLSPNFKIDINNKIMEANSECKDLNFDANLINLYSIKLTNIYKGGSEKGLYKTLNLKNLLLREYLSLEIEKLDDKKSLIISKVNTLLIEFKENIQIKVDNDFYISIIDDKKNIVNNEKYLNLYFNEAKLNLIILLLIFNSIVELSNDSKDKLIVLDDFITSLDIANRTFLIKYLIETFNKNKFQLIILTHNLEFFNLVKFILEEKITVNGNTWLFYQLYEINNCIELSNIQPISFENIEKEIINHPDIAGNLIRKKFENVIHSLAKDLILGSVESSNNTLTTIQNLDVLYLKSVGTGGKQKFYTSNNLLFEIEKKILEGTSSISEIQVLIEEYKIPKEKLVMIKNILNELKLYRKVIMHPLSHTESQFSIKELNKSLDLLKNLDSSMINIINSL